MLNTSSRVSNVSRMSSEASMALIDLIASEIRGMSTKILSTGTSKGVEGLQ